MKRLYTTVASLLMLLSITNAQTDSARAYIEKGLNEKAAKHYMVASRYFTIAAGFDPKNEDAYLQDAAVNMEMRRMDNARADYEKVYALDPDNPKAIKALTELYYDYHQYKMAINMAGKCKTCDNAERIIALSNYQDDNYEEAINGLMDVLKKDPKDAEATYALGRSYLEIEEYIKAVPFYQRAIMLDPSKGEWIYELGLIYYGNDDYKDAVAFFDRAAAAGYTQGSDFKENLGFACVYSGSFARGEKLLLGLLSQRPDNKELLRGVADAYYSHKMYDRSLEFCQKLIELDANDGMALYQAGLCFQKKGEKEKGQALCDRAIEIDPSLSRLRQKQMSVGL